MDQEYFLVLSWSLHSPNFFLFWQPKTTNQTNYPFISSHFVHIFFTSRWWFVSFHFEFGCGLRFEEWFHSMILRSHLWLWIKAVARKIDCKLNTDAWSFTPFNIDWLHRRFIETKWFCKSRYAEERLWYSVFQINFCIGLLKVLYKEGNQCFRYIGITAWTRLSSYEWEVQNEKKNNITEN